MKIFNHETVVGIFDSGKNVERAVTKLHDMGFGKENNDEIRVIDQFNINEQASTEMLIVAPAPGAMGPAGTAIPVEEQTGPDVGVTEQDARRALDNLGLDDEEAQYYARQIAHGAKLLVVETDSERAKEILDILKQARNDPTI